jgi:hypothetical protein
MKLWLVRWVNAVLAQKLVMLGLRSQQTLVGCNTLALCHGLLRDAFDELTNCVIVVGPKADYNSHPRFALFGNLVEHSPSRGLVTVFVLFPDFVRLLGKLLFDSFV